MPRYQFDDSPELQIALSPRSETQVPPLDQKNPFAHFNQDKDFGPSEYVTDPQFIAFGCSVTAGSGIVRNLTWPELAKRIFGYTINVASQPGSSVDVQFTSVAALARAFGKPKTIIGLLPTLDRTSIPVFRRKPNGQPFVETVPMLWNTALRRYMSISDFIASIRVPGTPLFTRAPLDRASYIFRAMQTLDYWDSMTNLRFSSWDRTTNDACTHFPSHVMPTYPVDPKPWWHADARWGGPTDRCHQPQTKQQAELWTIAADDLHPGVHHQVHFCETLFDRSISNDDLAGIDDTATT